MRNPDDALTALRLNNRTFNALTRRGINTVGELTAMTARDLADFREFGVLMLADVVDALAAEGMRLGSRAPHRLTDAPKYLSVEDVAAHFDVTPKTVRRWIDSGYMPFTRLGPKLVRVRAADLAEFEESINA